MNKYIDYLKTHTKKYSLIEEWVSHYINDQNEEIVMRKSDTIDALVNAKFEKENIKIEIPKEIDKKR